MTDRAARRKRVRVAGYSGTANNAVWSRVPFSTHLGMLRELFLVVATNKLDFVIDDTDVAPTTGIATWDPLYGPLHINSDTDDAYIWVRGNGGNSDFSFVAVTSN